MAVISLGDTAVVARATVATSAACTAERSLEGFREIERLLLQRKK
jgi:hypothetical protein